MLAMAPFYGYSVMSHGSPFIVLWQVQPMHFAPKVPGGRPLDRCHLAFATDFDLDHAAGRPSLTIKNKLTPETNTSWLDPGLMV